MTNKHGEGGAMATIKPTLIIEDCSALGQISTVAAVTILQAFGETTALLPTSLLSTQTEGFGQPAQLSTAPWLTQVSLHWRKQGINFANALVGYIGSAQLIKQVDRLLVTLQPRQLVIDPVMGDQGSLYPGLPSTYPQLLQPLCRRATVITPNWTELCQLAGQPVVEPTTDHLLGLVNQLREQEITAQIVVTGVKQGAQIGCWVVGDHCPVYLPVKYFPGHYYGTGDTFAALLTGFLNQQVDLRLAATKATAALTVAVAETSQLPVAERRYGLRLKNLLATLAKGVEQ